LIVVILNIRHDSRFSSRRRLLSLLLIKVHA
jgi:hypothetical protein